MKEHDLVLALLAQNRSATAIHQHLVETFGGLAISYATYSTCARSSAMPATFCEGMTRHGSSMPATLRSPEVARLLINTPKLMITIFWNASGIHIIDYVPSGESFNSAHFIERIFPTIAGLTARHAVVRQRKVFVLDMGNSPMRKSKAVMETRASIPVQRALHPLSPRDFAPSDSVSFGYPKGKRTGREFDKQTL
jgi:hypothetical protein